MCPEIKDKFRNGTYCSGSSNSFSFIDTILFKSEHWINATSTRVVELGKTFLLLVLSLLYPLRT